MFKGKIVLVTGGVRSGKSRFAEDLTASFGLPVVYIATATVMDSEMEMRVKIHQQRRPESWETVEEPIEVIKAIASKGSPDKVLMIDCLTLWITNLMFRQELPEDEEAFKKIEEEILDMVRRAAETARQINANMVIVSNESGLGLIPPDRLSRKYQEIVGRANETVAKAADEVYLVVSGIPVEIKEMSKKIYDKMGE